MTDREDRVRHSRAAARRATVLGPAAIVQHIAGALGLCCGGLPGVPAFFYTLQDEAGWATQEARATTYLLASGAIAAAQLLAGRRMSASAAAFGKGRADGAAVARACGFAMVTNVLHLLLAGGVLLWVVGALYTPPSPGVIATRGKDLAISIVMLVPIESFSVAGLILAFRAARRVRALTDPDV